MVAVYNHVSLNFPQMYFQTDKCTLYLYIHIQILLKQPLFQQRNLPSQKLFQTGLFADIEIKGS